MKIEEYIRTHLEKRLEEAPVLVVYDPEGRYRDICKGMDSDRCKVVDGSDSTIRGREAAMDRWRLLADEESKGRSLLIYLPIPLPRDDREKMGDPYWIFAVGDHEFPRGEGETYKALCQKAFPEHAEQIDDLFARGVPDFATINNLAGDGARWPVLRTVLKAESAAEILTKFLSPTMEQKNTLDGDPSWVPEMREFCSSVLGLHLKTKGQKQASVAAELWRFLLFSEFAFDLPDGLPKELEDVPRAPEKRAELVNTVCEALRGSEQHQASYMETANQVAQDLKVEEYFDASADFGKRDTFAFEERTFLNAFSNDLIERRNEEARKILEDRKGSVWVKHETGRLALWTVAERALQLVEVAGDVREKMKAPLRSLEDVLRFYADTMRQVDAAHRELEQAVADVFGELETLEPAVSLARTCYRDSAEDLQRRFVSSVGEEGWPCSAWPANTQVFDRFVRPFLDERRKTALLMVDALRYELAVALENALAGKYKVELQPVCAQLPTITSVGMASLLPDAETLRLKDKEGKPVPVLGDREIGRPKDRLEHARKILGDRCAMIDLKDLASGKKVALKDTVDFLLVKTTEIDDAGESNPGDAAHAVTRVLQKIRAAVNKLQGLGFEHVVAATDHGFVLFDEMMPGHVVDKPPGVWSDVKSRILLGKGSGTHGCRVFEAGHVGVRGEYEHVAVPESFGAFAKSAPYFHGGLSLQECVLPVLILDLRWAEGEPASKIELRLSYKGGRTDRVTTRRPMIELSIFQAGLFGETLEIQVEASAGKRVVGEVGACDQVDPSTGLVRLKPGEAVKVPLRMDDDFQGPFEVRAYNPETNVLYDSLKLKTDYME